MRGVCADLFLLFRWLFAEYNSSTIETLLQHIRWLHTMPAESASQNICRSRRDSIRTSHNQKSPFVFATPGGRRRRVISNLKEVSPTRCRVAPVRASPLAREKSPHEKCSTKARTIPLLSWFCYHDPLTCHGPQLLMHSLMRRREERRRIRRRRRRSVLPAVTGEASTTRCRAEPAHTHRRRREGDPRR